MTTRIVIIGAILALLPAMAAAAPSSEDLKLLEPDALERPWVGFRNDICTPPKAGPGSSLGNAIKLDSFYDIFASAVTWRTEENGIKENQWEQQNDLPLTPDLHCKWVHYSGHFRRTDYQGYAGVIAKNSAEFYVREGGPGTKIRSSIHLIENWADSAVRSALINGADIEVAGLFYDLCKIARQKVDKDVRRPIIMSGPCHYGDFTGLMIRDAVLIKQVGTPFQRLKGEVNRSVIGDIRPIDSSWPEFDLLRSTTIERLNLIRSGAEKYWRWALSGITPNGDLIKERSDNPDNWIKFLAEHPRSPLHRSKSLIEANEFRIFRLRSYGGGESEEKINIAVGCFCTTD